MNEETTADAASRRSFRLHNATVPARPVEPALYLVATPIGNLGDITLRALETLAGADVLACEDTRVTRVLLDRYGIQNRPFAYHEHNADEAGPRLLQALEAGARWRWFPMPARRWSPIPAIGWRSRRLRQVTASFPFPAPPRRLQPLSAPACRTMLSFRRFPAGQGQGPPRPPR